MRHNMLFVILLSIIVLLSAIPVQADTALTTGGTPAYDGVPAFPSTVGGNECTAYVLFYDTSTDIYYAGAIYDDLSEAYLYVSGKNVCISTKRFYLLKYNPSTSTSWIVFSQFSRENIDSVSYLLYSSVDIYTDSTCTNIYFPLVAPSTKVMGLTATEITQMTMKQILSLVPSVMGLVVCWMGLRKAFQMLLARLRQA